MNDRAKEKTGITVSKILLTTFFPATDKEMSALKRFMYRSIGRRMMNTNVRKTRSI